MTQFINHPLVSVVMPTFNQAAYIQEAITSVLSQSYSNLELIIVDNYSTDSTLKIIESFHDERIQCHQLHNHGVIALSRNYGVTKVIGDYVAFIDSDDVWEPLKLEYQIPHMQHKKIICVSSNCKLIGDAKGSGNYLDSILKGEYRDFGYDDVMLENPIITSSVLMRKDLFFFVGGFDESNIFRFIEDWELWLRLAHQGVVRILNVPLVKYRMYYKPGRDLRDVRKRTLGIIDKHYNLGLLGRAMERKARGNCYVSIGRAFLDVGNYKGVTFFIKGFFLSHGTVNKLRATIGLLLFLVPGFLRSFLIEKAPRIKYFLSKKV